MSFRDERKSDQHLLKAVDFFINPKEKLCRLYRAVNLSSAKGDCMLNKRIELLCGLFLETSSNINRTLRESSTSKFSLVNFERLNFLHILFFYI